MLPKPGDARVSNASRYELELRIHPHFNTSALSAAELTRRSILMREVFIVHSELFENGQHSASPTNSSWEAGLPLGLSLMGSSANNQLKHNCWWQERKPDIATFRERPQKVIY